MGKGKKLPAGAQRGNHIIGGWSVGPGSISYQSGSRTPLAAATEPQRHPHSTALIVGQNIPGGSLQSASGSKTCPIKTGGSTTKSELHKRDGTKEVVLGIPRGPGEDKERRNESCWAERLEPGGRPSEEI